MTDYKKKYLRDAINQIKGVLSVNDDYSSRDVYLKKGNDIIGLHEITVSTENGNFVLEAWCNAYDNDFKFLASIYQLYDGFDSEVEDLKTLGWLEIKRDK